MIKKQFLINSMIINFQLNNKKLIAKRQNSNTKNNISIKQFIKIRINKCFYKKKYAISSIQNMTKAKMLK